ncbi:MAG: hypothetical protein IPI67_23930 [Myxococcales bacterium]|nr:hypothetical protein [Myxococcales bacterium]
MQLRFVDGRPLDQLLASARCQQALARAEHFQDSACPFRLPGIRVELSSDGRSIRIRSSDPQIVGEVRRRARAAAAR